MYEVKKMNKKPYENRKTYGKTTNFASKSNSTEKLKSGVSRTGAIAKAAPVGKELAIFTHAKKLSEYIFTITESSPKKLRWSIIGRLQNCSVEIIENLYNANFESGEKRLEFQKEALKKLYLLDYFSETAKVMNAITLHQLGVMARYILDCKKLLLGWQKSTKEAMKN